MKLKKWLCLSLICPVSSLLAAPVSVVPVAGTFVYTQNFDTLYMGTAAGNGNATPAWADDSTIPGWWFAWAGNSAATPATTGALGGAAMPYFFGDGSAAPNLNLNSQGAANNADRAFAAPSTTARGEQSGIVLFTNPGTKAVDLTTLAYNGEMLRANNGANNRDSILVWYRVVANQAAALNLTFALVTSNNTDFINVPANTPLAPGNVTAPTSNYLTGWTNLPSATYTTNTTVNAVAATQAISAVVPTGTIRVPAGQMLAVRFSNTNDAGTDALIGVDDLSVTFTEVNGGISATVANLTRNTHGTPNIPTDDTMDGTITVDKVGNLGNSWHATSAPLVGTAGTYGAPVNLSIPISNFTTAPHNLSIAVVDDAVATATANVSITAPWCTLTPTIGSVAFNDAGTPGDPSDDTISATVSATSTYGGSDYSVTAGGGGQTFNASYGANATVTGIALGSTATLTFTDSADPACSANLTVRAPGIIGHNLLTGGNIVSAYSATAQNWTLTQPAGGPTLTQTAGGNQTDQIVESDVIDLSSTGAVKVTAKLDAITGASSGFELPDGFGLELVIDGAAPVSILGSYDTNANGRLNGNATGVPGELPNTDTKNTTQSYTFSHVVPATANNLKIRIIGNSNSTSETLTFTLLKLEAPPSGMIATAGASTYDNKGTVSTTDDEVVCPVTIEGIGLGASTGWTSNGTPASGLYSTPTHTFRKLISAIATPIVFNDALAPATTASVTLPTPVALVAYLIGTNNVTNSDLIGTPLDAASTSWTNDPATRKITLIPPNTTQVARTVDSTVINIAGQSGVKITARVDFEDTSSGFEPADNFRIDVKLDGTTVVSMLPSADDVGSDGILIGGTVAAPGELPLGNTNKRVDINYEVPPGTLTVQVVITGNCNSANELMRVTNVEIGSFQDTDMDGMPDSYENSNGLNPGSADDALTDLDGDGSSNLNEYKAGTNPQSGASNLKILDIVRVGANYNISFASVAGKKYRLQTSAEPVLVGFQDAAGVPDMTATGAVTTFVVPVANAPVGGTTTPYGFARVAVVP